MAVRLAVALILAWVSCQAEGQQCKFHIVSLQYPKLALFAQIQGEVLITAEIDSEGRVRSATASSGHQILRDAAEHNMKSWQFEPGSPRQVRITYRFVLKESAVSNPRDSWTVDFPDRVEIVSDRQAPLG